MGGSRKATRTSRTVRYAARVLGAGNDARGVEMLYDVAWEELLTGGESLGL